MRLTPEAFHTWSQRLQLRAEAVAKVECPTCGALRTLHPQGRTTVFPTHPRRLMRPSREEIRWIRRGSVWELFSPTPKKQQP
jgi:hypothetical protein